MKLRRGFTLIEILVVIAIIAILSGVVLFQIEQSRVKARDAARVSDINQIQIALEAYFEGQPMDPITGNKSYPNNYEILATGADKYIPAVPKDPSTHQNYGYIRDAVNPAFCLGAKLENATDQATKNSALCTIPGFDNTLYNYIVSR